MGFTVDSVSDAGPADRRSALLLPPLALLMVVAILVFQVFYLNVAVQGDSMEPALYGSDRLLVTREYKVPRRGDIVSIKPAGKGGMGIIKRVVGIPGDVVTMDGDRVSVSGAAEGPWKVNARVELTGWIRTWTVPQGQVFVLGDNRPISQDSRYFGFVPLEEIHGRAILLYWPTSRMRRLDRP